jgi:hypothetical protein
MLYYHKILVRESGLQCAWSKGCSQWPNCNHFLKKMEMCNQKMRLFKLYPSQSKLITLHSSEFYSQDSTVFWEEHNESNNISIQDNSGQQIWMVLNQTYHVIQLHGFASFKLRLLKLASLLVHHSPSPKHKQKLEHLFWDAILQVCTLIPLYLQTNKQTNIWNHLWVWHNTNTLLLGPVCLTYCFTYSHHILQNA